MATTLTRRNCALTVNIHLEFQNNTGRLNAHQFEDLVNGWRIGIENLWNGPRGYQNYKCCHVRFRVITRIGAGTPGYHQVNVRPGPATSSSQVGPASGNATWDDGDTGNVAAHETGHLMGLGDEYHYDNDGNYVNDNRQPAGQPQSIMAQTWGNVAALQSHIDAILRRLNAHCPWWCCIFDFLHRLPTERQTATPGLVIPPGTLREGGTMTSQTMDDILKSIETGRPETMAAGLDTLIAKGPGSANGLIEALKSSNVLRRWAAAAALGEIGDSQAIPALSQVLQDENISVRIQAAHSLAKLGDTQGFATLIEALMSDQVMIGHAPELASDYSNQVLESITDRSFGFSGSMDPATRSEIVKRWQAWWKDHETSFRIKRY